MVVILNIFDYFLPEKVTMEPIPEKALELHGLETNDILDNGGTQC